jgi:oligopeptide/dipeptide ABC transporter ATP-binding protein
LEAVWKFLAACFRLQPANKMVVSDANQYRVDLTHPSYPSRDLLGVFGLTVDVRFDQKLESRVLKDVTFTVGRGEIVGLLGESGSGKTTTALSLMQMLPANARVSAGSIYFKGRSLLGLEAPELRHLRGSEGSIIYQDSDVLHPVMRVGAQVMEVLRAHRRARAAQMRDEIYSLFAAIGLHDCDRIYRAYPHQLSGGERRRVAIAQALICKPRLVIADEPTAWLDSGTTDEILSVFQQLRKMYNTAFLLISHDPDALAIADRVLVMYAGEIIETGTSQEIFEDPKHPYTRALLQCRMPATAASRREGRLHPLACIPGQSPDPWEALTGCAFSARCSRRMEVCDSQHPDLLEIAPARLARCFQYEEKG